MQTSSPVLYVSVPLPLFSHFISGYYLHIYSIQYVARPVNVTKTTLPENTINPHHYFLCYWYVTEQNLFFLSCTQVLQFLCFWGGGVFHCNSQAYSNLLMEAHTVRPPQTSQSSSDLSITKPDKCDSFLQYMKSYVSLLQNVSTLLFNWLHPPAWWCELLIHEVDGMKLQQHLFSVF